MIEATNGVIRSFMSQLYQSSPVMGFSTSMPDQNREMFPTNRISSSNGMLRTMATYAKPMARSTGFRDRRISATMNPATTPMTMEISASTIVFFSPLMMLG